jgi:hypothetical protein
MWRSLIALDRLEQDTHDMASLAAPIIASPDSTEQRERRFFLGLAIAIAGTVLVGFGGYILLGISHFDAPWWVHLHAVTFMGWIGLYLLQNLLIVRGAISIHRRVGRVMAAWAIWMVIVGTVLLGLSIAAKRAPPPVFSAAMLITMDEINMIVFAALVGAGLWLRRKTDWHRRLMLSATVSIIAPALGRITVIAGAFSWRNIILMELAFLAVAMGFDLVNRGRLHPALLWGAAAIGGMGLVVPPIAAMPAVAAFADSLAANGSAP